MYKTYFLCIERSEIIGGIKFCKTTVFPYRKNQLYKLLIDVSFNTSFRFCPKISCAIIPNIEIHFSRNVCIVITSKPFFTNFIFKFFFLYRL